MLTNPGIPQEWMTDQEIFSILVAAIIHDFDPRKAAFGQHHPDSPRSGIDRVLDQLLQCRSRPFDHLAGGNSVDQIGWEAADFRHFPAR